ncbi:MAG: hypothetical protein AAF581_07150 [Planctomycetota bacterium]
MNGTCQRVLSLLVGVALLWVAQGNARAQSTALNYGSFGPQSLAALAATESVDEDEGWLPDGFISGLRGGFESFPRPIGSPLYFEDPFINTDLRPLLLHHEFPRDSLLGGGDLTVQAVQARLALTDRLQFIATQDGHADLEADALPAGEGYNDLAAGLKYAFYVDHDEMAIASIGARWTLSNGSREVFKGTEDEISVFVTGAKKYGKLHVIADVVGRITTHHGHGNDSLSWDINCSYELFDGFFPLVEYHGFLYLSNGDRLAVRDGLLDYGNLGAGDVRGSSANWATIGFRWQFKEGVSWGVGQGVGLNRNSNNDIFRSRFTTNLVFTF